MATIAIFYFSGTGNTRFAAACITEAFHEMGHDCRCHNIETVDEVETLLDDVDIVGFGYPIYGSMLPLPVRDFFTSFSAQGKRGFVFCTQMMYSGDGAAYGRRQLKQSGIDIRQLEHFNLPNNITDVPFLRRRRPLNYPRIKKRTEKKAARFVQRVIADHRRLKGANPLSLCLGLLQRVPFRKMMEAGAFGRVLIDHDTCVRCARCVLLCPVEAFDMKNKRIETVNACVGCYRCINHCPVCAMRLSKKHRVKTPYLGPVPNMNAESLRSPQWDMKD